MKNFEKIGKFILLERISKGGMAEIFLAAMPGAKNVLKFFAIKRILPHHEEQKRLLKMFEREAKVASNLNQNNIVKMFEFGIHKDTPYLVMELLNGVTLSRLQKDLISRKMHLSYSHVAHIMAEVANGLNYSHFICTDSTTGKPLNIIHRDISPQNIMITFDGEIKIIDYGIAKPEFSDSLTAVGVSIGKASHMSPEQARGEVLDYRTDLFSLGVMGWEMIARESLFIRKNYSETILTVIRCEIPPLSKYDAKTPEKLSEIIGRCLEKDKYDRYQNGDELARDLSRFIKANDPDFFSQDFRKFISDLYAKEKTAAAEKLSKYSHQDNFEETVLPPIPEMEALDDRTIKIDPVKPKAARISVSESPKAKPVAKIETGFPRADESNSLYGLSSYTTNAETQIGSSRLKSIVVAVAILLGLIGLYSIFKSDFGEVVQPERNVASVQGSGNALEVSTIPDGAEIYVDGRSIGIVTPTSFVPSSERPFVLEIRKDGFRSISLKVDPKANNGPIQHRLQKIDYANIDIIVDPQTNIQIKLNGKVIPVPELPMFGYLVEANRPHQIEVKNLRNNKSSTRSIRLATDGFQELQFNLK